ncbi:MAG: GH3 auxin-responsive promoter family protein [Gemmataceae bacterium]
MTSVLERLTGALPARQLAQGLLNQYAQRRAGKLNRLSVARTQEATLCHLVRRARDTRFGRAHGFGHIRAITDYQRQVPLREYEAFWTEYWQPDFPRLVDVTWPGQAPYLALSSGTVSGTTKYIPVSAEMLRSNRRAALTTLALYLAAYPNTPIFTGRIFFLGGSTDLRQLADGVRGGDLSGIAAREVSSLLRPYTFPPLELGLLADWEEKVRLLAQRGAELPITLLSGVPSWLLLLFDRLKQVTGKQHIADIWPTLRVVVHGGTKFDPYRNLFRQEIGSDTVHFLETYPCSEGFVATEDPRYQLLRVVPDHGIFFEFVPVAELPSAQPTRHTLAKVAVGVQYAVVLTTCAGLWSYVVGDTVCFEQRDPPLLRFTGRTRYFLSAFGEHVISEEVERAVAQAAEATGAAVIDFHVGPIFPEAPSAPGRHRYLVEFARPPADLARFATELDAILCQLNEDYQAHRAGDLTMLPPEVVVVRPGGFADWMRSRGKLGGQHKVPRMDNSGTLTRELSAWLASTRDPQESAE